MAAPQALRPLELPRTVSATSSRFSEPGGAAAALALPRGAHGAISGAADRQKPDKGASTLTGALPDRYTRQPLVG